MNEVTTPLGLVRMFAQTSTQINVLSDSVIESVRNGEINPLEVQVNIKAMERAFERIVKEIKDNVMREADKYPGTEFEFLGNKIQKGAVKTEYDFTVCQDAEWERLDAEVKRWSERRKERETFLKAITNGHQDIITDDGEAATIYPPKKTQVDGIKITIR